MQKLDQNFPAIDEPSDAMVDLAISIMKSVLFLEHPPRVEKGLPWVRSNFARFGLLDEQVVFLQGWFSETLPTAPGLNAIAVLRLDGDTFESTIDALNTCYPKLSPGGEFPFVQPAKILRHRRCGEQSHDDNMRCAWLRSPQVSALSMTTGLSMTASRRSTNIVRSMA